MPKFQPMLAETVKDTSGLIYPLFASIKLDGVRCLLDSDRGPITRALKPIPNRFLREVLTPYCQHNLDGEILLNHDKATFQDTMSAVMSEGGQPDCIYYVFDQYDHPSETFNTRFSRLELLRFHFPNNIQLLRQIMVGDIQLLQSIYDTAVAGGEEGLILRHTEGPYKFGRSTQREQWMLKMKPILSDEGVIIGVEPLMSNTNPMHRDALGYAERSSHKEGLVAQPQVGKFILETNWGKLRVGTGLTLEQRLKYWEQREELIGKIVTFAYQGVGIKDLPRFPSFKGMRDPSDTDVSKITSRLF